MAPRGAIFFWATSQAANFLRVLASRDLIGASLLVDQGDRLRRVRLDGIERDPNDKRRDVAPADVI